MKYFVLLLTIVGFAGSAFALTDEPIISQTSSHNSENMLVSGESFAINLHQTVEFDSLRMEFSGIEDSRCPSDVLCVWEGQASLTFLIYDDTENQAITFTTGKVMTAYVGPYEIKLLDIEPYPTSTKDISEQYVATVSISKSKKENITAPLKQIDTGVALVDVKCNDGKHPAYKYNRMMVACVSEETLEKLIKRGWAKLFDDNNEDVLLERYKDESVVKAFHDRYDDVNEYVQYDRVNYSSGNNDNFVRMSLYYDENLEVTHKKLFCHFDGKFQHEIAEEDILGYLQNYHCMTYQTGE
jgi:hypothetical protein